MVHNSGGGVILFGQVGQLFRWDLCLAVGALISVLVFGLWAIIRVRSWRAAKDDASTPAELIDHYQAMVDDGSLDPEEFARIKAQLEANPVQDQSAPASNEPRDSPKQES